MKKEKKKPGRKRMPDHLKKKTCTYYLRENEIELIEELINKLKNEQEQSKTIQK